jgi:GNAT superfamily N-acetyltransferase
MATIIRPATRADVPQILAFIHSLAVYEREPDAVMATEASLERDGFSSNPFFFCLIAEHDGKAAGFALYFFNYSTWVGRPGIYLEDLFVEPELRGLGIGKALLQQVAAEAMKKGCQRLQWEVLDWNTTAIDFYRAMGAEFLDEWRNVRVSGVALERLSTCLRQPTLDETVGGILPEGEKKIAQDRAPTDRSSSVGWKDKRSAVLG